MPKNYRSDIRAASARTVKAIAAALVLSAPFAVFAQTQKESSNPQSAGLSRAEVVADLTLWRRAGVDRYEPMVRSGLETQAYRDAYQEYLRLRNSEQFQIEVQKALGK